MEQGLQNIEILIGTLRKGNRKDEIGCIAFLS